MRRAAGRGRTADQVASMTLYEPVAFHVFKTIGPDGKTALKEIMAIAGDISLLV